MMGKVLFVCTGNTCRSPMAEFLFNQKAEASGLPWRASSAGLAAGNEPVSEGACRALLSRGLDVRSHRSRQVTPGMVQEADLVLCMTSGHARTLQALCPAASIAVLGGRDIIDPYGAPQALYDSVMEQISGCLDGLLEQIRTNVQEKEQHK